MPWISASGTFREIRDLAEALRDDGFRVHLAEPAPDAPLGGIVTIDGDDFDPVQVVNLTAPGGRHGKIAREAITSAHRESELGLPLVDVAHLIALKLLPGSRKDELDVLELLRANRGCGSIRSSRSAGGTAWGSASRTFSRAPDRR